MLLEYTLENGQNDKLYVYINKLKSLEIEQKDGN